MQNFEVLMADWKDVNQQAQVYICSICQKIIRIIPLRSTAGKQAFTFQDRASAPFLKLKNTPFPNTSKATAVLSWAHLHAWPTEEHNWGRRGRGLPEGEVEHGCRGALVGLDRGDDILNVKLGARLDRLSMHLPRLALLGRPCVHLQRQLAASTTKA